MNASLDQIIDSYLCNADLSGSETPEQMADALLTVMPWTGDDYSADTIRAELIDTIEHRQAVSESRLPKYHVNANAVDFGEVEAKDAQEARDVAARMAGYQSEADMVERVGGPSELVASEVESGK